MDQTWRKLNEGKSRFQVNVYFYKNLFTSHEDGSFVSFLLLKQEVNSLKEKAAACNIEYNLLRSLLSIFSMEYSTPFLKNFSE